METIRVLVADDHPTFREGLVRVVADQDDMEVVAQAGDGEEAVQLASQVRPDVAVLDVAMPKLNGIEATRLIKEVSPKTAVLIVSAYGHDPYVLGAIEAGASGYLLKEARIWELVNAVRSLHAGETVLDPTAARKVFGRLVHSTSRGRDTSQRLHQRELEVLKLATKGMSNKEIAVALSISVRTVQAHLVNIFNKLEVSSRTEAVIRALKEGWVTLDDLP
ncbi:MAG: DNA-binding response regulator [Chloroflexi bacterium]|nr:MAG: DNA-binding response regulator [Chloroflexota bacterium]RLC97327.1 MAG: DNA-binding response regulator [Chloroflexota bacterium]